MSEVSRKPTYLMIRHTVASEQLTLQLVIHSGRFRAGFPEHAVRSSRPLGGIRRTWSDTSGNPDGTMGVTLFPGGLSVRFSWTILAVLLLTLPLSADAAEVLLQNDGFVSGQQPGFQAGFVAGESAASLFNTTGPYPLQIKRVQFLYGPDATTRTVTIRIYNTGGAGGAPERSCSTPGISRSRGPATPSSKST